MAAAAAAAAAGRGHEGVTTTDHGRSVIKTNLLLKFKVFYI
jgi:hypothetical protein